MVCGDGGCNDAGGFRDMTQSEVFQVGLMLAVATLVGASTGYAASLRGRFKVWAVIVAPIAACAVNIGVLFVLGLAVPNSSGGSADWTWAKMVASTAILAIGIGLWGAIPALLASLVFQSHCRYSKRT
jgi:hypothetical protein